MTRRDFVKTAAGAAAVSVMPSVLRAADGREAIRAMLFHLGHNMWSEWLPPELMKPEFVGKGHWPDFELKFETESWERLVARMVERKINLVVLDLGEGIVYPSHPELAVKGSWSPDRMKEEVVRLKGLGIEAIPKLNFSATHDGWLKQYGLQLTQPAWYAVVRDVIRDVAEIFGRPRFFHIGFDEENVGHAGGLNYFVMRKGELWWHDFLYTVKCVEDCGSRPWVWSDHGWGDMTYFTRCPKSVVQSNWYYDEAHGGFDPKTNKTDDHKRLIEFWNLEKAGFDQIPCGTNWVGWKRKQENCGADDVMSSLVKLGREVIAPERLLGFMMAPWARTDRAHEDWNLRGIDLLAEALV